MKRPFRAGYLSSDGCETAANQQGLLPQPTFHQTDRQTDRHTHTRDKLWFVLGGLMQLSLPVHAVRACVRACAGSALKETLQELVAVSSHRYLCSSYPACKALNRVSFAHFQNSPEVERTGSLEREERLTSPPLLLAHWSCRAAPRPPLSGLLSRIL